MAVHQQPSTTAEIAKLAKRLEELERVVRRGKTEPNMRDLTDADLTKAKDGEVPKYNKLTGRWKPGAAGGAGWIVIRSSAVVSSATGNSTTILFDTIEQQSGTHGVTADATPGRWTLAAGSYIVGAGAVFTDAAGGFRELHLTGTVSLVNRIVKTQAPAISDVNGHTLSICAPLISAAGANQLWVFGLQTSGGALNVFGRYLSIMKVG